GDYTLFAHLETLYLGVLARRTLITTNTVRVLEAANGKPIIFMPARHDHHRVQTGDGYAAYVAGRIVGAPVGVTTDEQASWWGGRGIGTVPHSLIASYGGNSVLAATKFAEWASDDINITVLVDFENHSVETALEVARALGPRLWDVRTQVDFMRPGGKLYVPGAETTVPAMKRLVDAARAAGIVHVASADDHELVDDEISEQPDFERTYPPHCLRGTRGARKIPETEQEDPV